MIEASSAMNADPSVIRSLLESAFARPEELGIAFYRRLFALDPGARSLFSEDMAHQRDKLVRTLASLLDAVDDPARAGHMLRNLGARHGAYGTDPGQYEAAGEALAGAMAEVRGAPLTAGEAEAWSAFYGWIAACMIEGSRTV